ncbi:MAG TPA: helix-turn-helix domain-containing protein [Bosea sp. (in: a-proteobacteria)]|jgi:hypothetical protein|uniref:helix-turn-helix domain-containing protein n=1 Tax=Bosea sp. (in: a-proteobacteria) TaxID=1871050 RepID=UPI002DDD8AE7|nr:helix-turn-helix domain-containing protein [Bosea sp. (in: a-proteobacteria)]HEV2556841.1 helix-turn-helix domain-containing protein [Bosea sp. (in: a-proteobacteria)]
MSERLTSLAQIVAAVELATTVTRREMLSDRRQPDVVEARCTVWWLASKLTLLSLPAIAAATRRNHTTVGHGIRQAEAQRAHDPDYCAATDALLATLHAAEDNAAIRLAQPVDPLATARRILWAPQREAVRISVSEVIAMAQLVVSVSAPPDPQTLSDLIQEIHHEQA